ncbi:transcriptional regulator, TetR family [Agreia bicolorata]|uniref:Transcriptional regulator, TetR family n=1 Tax=Agreia bicolorata TaxID=110935 RepID=A0A1T4WXL1_9MICO|nr:TetR/AcrR family transcriptional regulator [Agreia bicolorata]SKA81887.1 transcriptional regulator, TetR family [Agreia bicolorata]
MSTVRSAVLPDSFRSSADAPADPRAARTRQGILAAVSRLHAADADDISVSDIVREAKISRSSFYAHFSSLDDLAVALLRQEFASVAAPNRGDTDPASSLRESYTRLVQHFAQRQSLYSHALGLPLSRRAFDEVIAAYADQVLATLGAPTSGAGAIRARLAATYVAGGTISLLSAWVADHHDISENELVDELIALLPPWLS